MHTYHGQCRGIESGCYRKVCYGCVTGRGQILRTHSKRAICLIERNENMETFCGWIDCYASYAGNYMPPGWANLLAVGIDQPLPSSVTLCPEHARALRAQLKNPAQKIDQMSPAGGA
jgi:hypothetical protein